jgi:hypothetical protein
VLPAGSEADEQFVVDLDELLDELAEASRDQLTVGS